MGRLLDKPISEAVKLPESEQEAIGAWLLAELDPERRWRELFGTPGGVLERMAEEVLIKHDRGLTPPLYPDQV